MCFKRVLKAEPTGFTDEDVRTQGCLQGFALDHQWLHWCKLRQTSASATCLSKRSSGYDKHHNKSDQFLSDHRIPGVIIDVSSVKGYSLVFSKRFIQLF